MAVEIIPEIDLPGHSQTLTSVYPETFCLKTGEDYPPEEMRNVLCAGREENFALLHELAEVLGGEVGASRAAVDAGMADHARQIGQTGVTVRPKLYIACGISGQIQHTAGMDGSSMIISINTDPEAPINKIADYAIMGDVMEVVPKMIKYYKQNSK